MKGLRGRGEEQQAHSACCTGSGTEVQWGAGVELVLNAITRTEI